MRSKTYKMNDQYDFCTAHTATSGRRGCCGRFEYTFNSSGYITKWECKRCGYTYIPLYPYKRNTIARYIDEDKCKSGKCGICEL